MTEAKEHEQLAEYIKMQYPKVMFNSDMSGIKLTIGQAVKAAKLRSNDKFPDLVIYERRMGYSGLFIELKKSGEVLHKKNGELKTEHLKEQDRTLRRLYEMGFMAVFAIGFDAAKKIIDSYLNNIL